MAKPGDVCQYSLFWFDEQMSWCDRGRIFSQGSTAWLVPSPDCPGSQQPKQRSEMPAKTWPEDTSLLHSITDPGFKGHFTPLPHTSPQDSVLLHGAASPPAAVEERLNTKAELALVLQTVALLGTRSSEEPSSATMRCQAPMSPIPTKSPSPLQRQAIKQPSFLCLL